MEDNSIDDSFSPDCADDCDSELIRDTFNNHHRGSRTRQSVVRFSGGEVDEQTRFFHRLWAAGVGEDLTERYRRYNTYSKLLECSSVQEILLQPTFSEKALQRIVVDPSSSVKSKKPISVSTTSSKPTSEELRNQFIWNELVKLNGSEQSEDSDPVTTEISRRQTIALMAQEGNQKKTFCNATGANNVLHFYRTLHHINDLNTFVKYKRPEVTSSFTRLQQAKRNHRPG